MRRIFQQRTRKNHFLVGLGVLCVMVGCARFPEEEAASVVRASPWASVPHALPTDWLGPVSKVTLRGNQAIAPGAAPPAVKRAVAAGNRLRKKPYRFGGGHAVLDDTGYDCSGSVSYVLRNAGLMSGQMPSKGFLNYGAPGPGRWITVWVRPGHVFLTVGGLRFDTTGRGGDEEGPRWRSYGRDLSKFTPRHPPGL